MTIFDLLKSLLFSKERIEMNCDDESQFTSFMINRWCSFYSKEISELINCTTNLYVNNFNTKQEQYDFYYYLLPKCRFKKINYVKKSKQDAKKDIEPVPEFMSHKEFTENVELTKMLNI